MCSRLADSAGGLILPVVCVAGLCGLRPVWSAAAVDDQEFPRSPRSFPGAFLQRFPFFARTVCMFFVCLSFSHKGYKEHVVVLAQLM